jgi:hypothetical protein
MAHLHVPTSEVAGEERADGLSEKGEARQHATR